SILFLRARALNCSSMSWLNLFSKAFSRSSNVVISAAPHWLVAAGYSSPARSFHPVSAVAESPHATGQSARLGRQDPSRRGLHRPLAVQGADRHPGRGRYGTAHGRPAAALVAL